MLIIMYVFIVRGLVCGKVVYLCPGVFVLFVRVIGYGILGLKIGDRFRCLFGRVWIIGLGFFVIVGICCRGIILRYVDILFSSHQSSPSFVSLHLSIFNSLY